MKFSVPVVYTITGWIEVEAESAKDVEKQTDGLCFSIGEIKDPSHDSDILYDEAEPIKEGK